MNSQLENILSKKTLDKADIIHLLSLSGDDEKRLFREAYNIKAKYVGRKTYFRGLIEFSNICSKNCLYCGIRGGNKDVHRYELTDDEVMGAVKYALDHNWGSIVIQAGERSNKAFTDRITTILKKIKAYSATPPGITLSLGEQSEKFSGNGLMPVHTGIYCVLKVPQNHCMKKFIRLIMPTVLKTGLPT